MKPNAAKYSGCKAREAVWSNWAVKCSQVNRDFFPKYDIVCQNYELLLRSLRSNNNNIWDQWNFRLFAIHMRPT